MGTFEIPLKSAGDFTLPALGLGTWQMGGRETRDPHNDDARDVRAVRAAIEAGLTHIDTAEIYAGGRAEEIVGEAIRPFDREKLFIVSKVNREHQRYDDLIAAAKASLARIGLARFDLYLLHFHSPEVALKETMRAMDFLIENGLTRFIGVSNFDVPLLEEARAATRYTISNNQIHYNLAVRDYETNGTLEYCRTNGILVTAYRPVQKASSGFLEAPPLGEIASRYGKTPTQTAINWVISKPNVVALIKTSNPRHLHEDLGAVGWRLAPEDESRLDREFLRSPAINLPR